MANIAVVGDIHGNLPALRSATAWLDANWRGSIIFVGDYVNRGADSRSVIDLLIRIGRLWGDRVTFLLGNHDAVLLDFVENGRLEPFFSYGGLSTMHSYLGSNAALDPITQFRAEFPPEHLAFLRNLVFAYETPELLVTHSGYAPARLASRSKADVVFGSHPEIFDESTARPAPLVVFGHYAQRSRSAFMGAHAICVDSGCGVIAGAPLSILTLPDRNIHTFNLE